MMFSWFYQLRLLKIFPYIFLFLCITIFANASELRKLMQGSSDLKSMFGEISRNLLYLVFPSFPVIFWFSRFIDTVPNEVIKPLMAKYFPFIFGNRKHIIGFSPFKSKRSLQSILEDINNCIIEKGQNQALCFFRKVKEEIGKLSSCNFSLLKAGSVVERFGIPYPCREYIPQNLDALCSDYDVMFCCELYRASFSQEGNTHIEISNVGQFDETLLPVYCQLHFQDPGTKGEILIDSSKLLKDLESAVTSTSIEDLPLSFNSVFHITTCIKGPSLRVTIGKVGEEVFEGDITICIKCMEWPQCSNWQERKDRLWPRTEDVKRISSMGFHLVANPISVNGKQLPTWRYSFSMAEVELSKLVPNVARKCLWALKIIYKDHLKPILPELSSYHIKTIFYNTLEKKQESFWIDDNIEKCLETLLQELHNCLEKGHCSHYWLQHADMFCEIPKNKHRHLSTLADKVKIIMKDPCSYIDDISWIRSIRDKIGL